MSITHINRNLSWGVGGGGGVETMDLFVHCRMYCGVVRFCTGNPDLWSVECNSMQVDSTLVLPVCNRFELWRWNITGQAECCFPALRLVPGSVFWHERVSSIRVHHGGNLSSSLVTETDKTLWNYSQVCPQTHTHIHTCSQMSTSTNQNTASPIPHNKVTDCP